MNADTLALAVMDDDGWGCAITTAPAARPAMCPGCFMVGANWAEHRCRGTASAPCFCFCRFDATPADPRYVAHFTPEAWIRDEAVEVDAPGPQEWDCTAYAAGHLDYLASTGRRRHERLDDPYGVLDNDDVFRDDPAAPAWVREWSGPFTIRIRTEEG